MPVAHVNGTELFYVEVGEGCPAWSCTAAWGSITLPCTPG
jgi:hypothetical protein